LTTESSHPTIARVAPGGAPPGRGETVLLVEDEPAVRNLTSRILTGHGYRVTAVATADEALAAQTSERGAPSLLLTDVVMPGMSGKELAEELERRHPGLRTLFMSGYTNDVVMRHGVAERRLAFIEKPFGAVALLEKVREVLAGGER
jgi:two-component system cell cycle sensor histidine kinase/response regulator CckA